MQGRERRCDECEIDPDDAPRNREDGEIGHDCESGLHERDAEAIEPEERVNRSCAP
jgi:hypothetical protein